MHKRMFGFMAALLLTLPLSAAAQMYGGNPYGSYSSYGASSASASAASASASSYWGGGYSYPYQTYSHMPNYQLYWCDSYYSYSPCPVQYYYPSSYYYYPTTYYYPTYYPTYYPYDYYDYWGGHGFNLNFSYGW